MLWRGSNSALLLPAALLSNSLWTAIHARYDQLPIPVLSLPKLPAHGRIGGAAVAPEKVKERCMQLRLPHCLSAALAVCVLLPVAVQAQVIPFAGNFGPGLAPSDNQMLFDSVARLNAAEPSKVGLSDSWSNPETKSHGSSTILKIFRSNDMTCHLVRHHIVAARPPSRNYRLTWCRTATGEWKTKG